MAQERVKGLIIFVVKEDNSVHEVFNIPEIDKVKFFMKYMKEGKVIVGEKDWSRELNLKP